MKSTDLIVVGCLLIDVKDARRSKATPRTNGLKGHKVAEQSNAAEHIDPKNCTNQTTLVSIQYAFD